MSNFNKTLLHLNTLRLSNTNYNPKGLIPDYEHALGTKCPFLCFFTILSSNENLAYIHSKNILNAQK